MGEKYAENGFSGEGIEAPPDSGTCLKKDKQPSDENDLILQSSAQLKRELLEASNEDLKECPLVVSVCDSPESEKVEEYESINDMVNESEMGFSVDVPDGYEKNTLIRVLDELTSLARSMSASLVSVLIVILFGPVMIATGKLLKQPKSNRIASWLQQNIWAIPTLKMLNIKLKVDGLENLRTHGGQIIVANHQGLLEGLAIPAAMAQKGLGISFVAKKELMKFPIFGAAIEALGVPAIDRGNTEEAKRSLQKTTKMINDHGLNVIWFPEGTRSTDGNIKPFKKGFAYMAIGTGQPVVPVYIDGSNDCMPKGTWLAKPGTISVRFGTPIETSGMSTDNKGDINALVDEVRAAVLEMKKEAETALANSTDIVGG